MTGPFESEAEAKALPAVRAAYAANSVTQYNSRMLADACIAGGVSLGAYDRRILAWVSGYEPQMCAVIAGIISRARPPRTDGSIGDTYLRRDGTAQISAADLATVSDALDVAADDKRDHAANCPDCDAHPAGLCGTCENRLTVADSYDDLARRLGGQQ